MGLTLKVILNWSKHVFSVARSSSVLEYISKIPSSVALRTTIFDEIVGEALFKLCMFI